MHPLTLSNDTLVEHNVPHAERRLGLNMPPATAGLRSLTTATLSAVPLPMFFKLRRTTVHNVEWDTANTFHGSLLR